jgi:hypothetical protein
MPQRTPEERKAYLKAYLKAYRIKNSEKIKAVRKVYRQENAENIKAVMKVYREENPEKCKKTNTISSWKFKGLICDDYDKLYELYLQSTNCDECDCKYSIKGDGVGRFKCMDHDHTTGLFRNFLCNVCNLRRG